MQGDPKFMRQAIELATENVASGHGGPFGAVIVRDGSVIATGVNQVTATTDPTAHAEVVAIRRACTELGEFSLAGCVMYTSCEPCPMCLAASHWARLDRVYFAATRFDAAGAGFDDARLYAELGQPTSMSSLPMVQISLPEAKEPFEAWNQKPHKIPY